ncbi:TcpE family conjugal transfer membrane protein [Thermoactinomyces vulgaris]|jgi:hypothetical protein|uniref:TcpE family conjugal transfer membrane protein n=1 Tax=Thermoactinomyces vulgaris TaxID=2026 RepID=UPI00362DACBD
MNEKERVYSYDAAWDSSITVYFSNRFFSFSLTMQEFFLFFFIELIMLFFDQVLGVSFAFLVHYIFVPGVLIFGLRKIRPEGKSIIQWLWSWVKFLMDKKQIAGNFDEVDIKKTKIRILSKKAVQ